MSKWWYYTIYRCEKCNAHIRDEYDHTAPWYDSGLAYSPVITEGQLREDCQYEWDERHKADLAEQEENESERQ